MISIINSLNKNIYAMESNESSTNILGLQALPKELLIMLFELLHDIKDCMNLSSTCRLLRSCMAAVHPHSILHLAWASSRTFFRPSPHFLCTAVAAQVGAWARESDENEAEFASGMPMGVDHIMELALRHKQIGLTLERIRELYEMRFSVINPISDLIDKCVGKQWYATPNYWDGGVDDAATIFSQEDILIFFLATYGELFGPDFEPFLDSDLSSRRTLKVETRLEFVKYCIPDANTWRFEDTEGARLPDGSLDPRRAIFILPGGPYHLGNHYMNAQAIVWLMKSTRWRPHWEKARRDAGAKPDFAKELDVQYFNRGVDIDWKQNMLENVMQCQGLGALGMIRPDTEIAERYRPKIREWREKIDCLKVEPQRVQICSYKTHEYPDLLGDLLCISGDIDH
ncbi:uncharacterized protein GGS22DRAFT_166344 [Annulohypoxylon maeteangense]|uniref:uncharacterized protein n=1 Tax=Annulohypoxylon maeteangense TaxID=1927788 RepID=UPI002007B1D3|nr:uncharacterized protein GGS22DRAFT_166344 [Annulohypoxylon maeteangense]KAI0883896.1 hypothetical protein GGS22DRAFT_166344 [Annulohypoxylon maeteangense]